MYFERRAGPTDTKRSCKFQSSSAVPASRVMSVAVDLDASMDMAKSLAVSVGVASSWP
jgi:hypothetical protein